MMHPRPLRVKKKGWNKKNDIINEKSWRFYKKTVSSIVLYIESLYNGGQ